ALSVRLGHPPAPCPVYTTPDVLLSSTTFPVTSCPAPLQPSPCGERLPSIHFQNFKALQTFSAHLSRMNVLVGPNNAGKSTFLSAFRLLAAGLRRAHTRRPEPIKGPNGSTWGYPVSLENLPISTENIHTDCADVDAQIQFKLSNGNSLTLYFPSDGGCFLLFDSERPINTTTAFKNAFPISVGHVPVLGPVEHQEELLQEESVRIGLMTHRASRYFRNYWHRYPDDFDTFAKLVQQTWPGMELERPRLAGLQPPTLTMFCREDRIDRELYWAGFGFQVWCQLLTHVVRSQRDSVLIVDEPDIYLHPDLQRHLLSILREAGPDILLATHSTEIISDADPSELLVINKRNKTAQRMKTTGDVQSALEILGSTQNITLTQLARSRRVLFVEGEDFKILARFAQQLGLRELSAGIDLTVVQVGGFSNWERVQSLAWGIERVLGQSLLLAAVFDRDYRCAEEVAEILGDLKSLKLAHILQRKEIENYLLIPGPLEKAITHALHERARRSGEPPLPMRPIEQLLREVTDPMHHELLGQYVTKRTQYLKSSGLDPATLTTRTLNEFQNRWDELHQRMELVPGKLVLSRLNEVLGQELKINISMRGIISQMRKEEIPADLTALLTDLESFRKLRNA
ncbi:MAG TPA: AAA family ATPase, partial [Archangium sp.]|nr:AAA family ATPase [Archangium sp.]